MKLTEVKRPDPWTRQLSTHQLERFLKQAEYHMNYLGNKMDKLLDDETRGDLWIEVSDREIRSHAKGNFVINDKVVDINGRLFGFDVHSTHLIEFIGKTDTIVPLFNKINTRFGSWYKRRNAIMHELHSRKTSEARRNQSN